MLVEAADDQFPGVVGRGDEGVFHGVDQMGIVAFQEVEDARGFGIGRHETTTAVHTPPYTAYLSGSLDAPAGLAYDPAADAISGTLSLSAAQTPTVTFGVRVAVTGTITTPYLVRNRACARPLEAGLADCEWSDEVVNYTSRIRSQAWMILGLLRR